MSSCVVGLCLVALLSFSPPCSALLCSALQALCTLAWRCRPRTCICRTCPSHTSSSASFRLRCGLVALASASTRCSGDVAGSAAVLSQSSLLVSCRVVRSQGNTLKIVDDIKELRPTIFPSVPRCDTTHTTHTHTHTHTHKLAHTDTTPMCSRSLSRSGALCGVSCRPERGQMAVCGGVWRCVQLVEPHLRQGDGRC